jgi:hypothetical protein
MRTLGRWLWIGGLGVALLAAPLAAQSPSAFDLLPPPTALTWRDVPSVPDQTVPYRPRLTEAQRRGLRIGVGVGFLVGGTVGYLLVPECEPANFGCVTRPVAVALAVAGCGLLGGIVGGVTGVLIAGATDEETRLQVRIPVP